MIIKNKTLIKAVIFTGLILSTSAAFAAKDVFPGIIDPCEQLWLVVDPNNANEDPNDGGECIDVPVNLTHAKVVFNLDTTVTNPDGSPIGLKHMVMFGNAMKHRIEIGEVDPADIAIVGVLHGDAMRAKWAFKNIPEGNNPMASWIEQIFALANPTDGSPAINMHLEACGVTLKGMQLKGAKLANGQPLDERAIYSSANGKIYLNQGALGRIIELQQNKFSYIQDD